MPLTICTHDGPFHADDVFAVAMLRRFVDADARVDRSRDPERWRRADVVVDVGGVFDAATRRFDHHQASYRGDRSSAGMVLDWLLDAGHVDAEVGAQLREGWVSYIDAVDNGRRTPDPAVPCLPRMVSALATGPTDAAEFDEAFARAVHLVQQLLDGVVAAVEAVRAADAAVRAEMDAAAAAGRVALHFDRHLSWKEPYFANGGADHPTEFVLFPGLDGSWRVVCVPPELGSFAQKRPLPEAWAGLTDAALERVSGIPGARFCHRNRFIAVFATREGALQAIEQASATIG